MANEPVMAEHKIKEEYTGKKLRIGIVGTGNIAETHINAYKEVPAAEIVAACDIDSERLKLTCDKHNINKRYDSIEEMIANEELDAINVCVWNCNHAKCAIYGLERGLHVLCEKPMAYSAEEAIAMKEAADKAGKLLMVGFVKRFGDDTALAQEFIDADMLGVPYYSKATYLRRHGAPGGWFCDKARSGGGPIIDLGVHVIDHTRYLMGSPKPVSVYAMYSSAIGTRPELINQVGWTPMKSKFDTGVSDCEDFGVALIRYDNGAVTLLETSYDYHGENKGETWIFGTKGGMQVSGDMRFKTTINNRLADILPVKNTKDTDPFIKEMEHFVDCALNGTPCNASAEDGIWVMKILDAIYESARTGHEVIIK